MTVRRLKKEEKAQEATQKSEITQKTNDFTGKEISTAMKENEKLSDEINCLEEMLAESEIKNEQSKYCNQELKSILISFGLGEGFKLLENIKIELKEKNNEVEQLKIAVNKGNDYHEKLKNSLFLGMQELFEQNPKEKAAIQEIKEEVVLIQESPVEINQNTDDDVVEKVIKMLKEGKTIIQIRHTTKLNKKEVEDIIKNMGGTLENVS